MTTTAPVSNCTVIYQLGDRLIRPTEKQERRGLIRVGVGATFEVAYVASTCERAVAGARHRIQIRSAAGAGERLSVTMTGIGIDGADSELGHGLVWHQWSQPQSHGPGAC
jgi:hypothetical protein